MSKKQVNPLPCSIEAERCVLGGVMLNNAAWDEVAERVREEDFYNHQHRMIFRAMFQLATSNKPVDILTITEELKAIEGFDIGDAYLLHLLNDTPSPANIVTYADIVREKSILRQLIQSSAEIIEKASSALDEPVSELLNEAEKKIFSIAQEKIQHNKRRASLQEISKITIDGLEKLSTSGRPIPGLSTGYKALDNMTGGLHSGSLTIIAGRPSMGKSTLAANIAEHAALSENVRVVIFSMEMSIEAIGRRLFSSQARIPGSLISTGRLDEKEWNRVANTAALFSGNTNIIVHDDSPLSPFDIRASCRRAIRDYGPIGLVVVDYLQMMRVKGYKNDRVGEMTEVSGALKNLAKELRVPVIAVSSMNRESEKRADDKRPRMSDLRDSGSIESDADLIMLIYRDEYYNKDTMDKGIAEVIIAKQREGAVGTIKLAFLGELTRFENLR